MVRKLVFRLRRGGTWTEPRLPRWLKINPGSDPLSVNEDGPQPGDLTMRETVEQFLTEPEGPEGYEPPAETRSTDGV